VAAALSSEAEEVGTKVRTFLGVPAYSVRYAAPDSGHPTGPTYWLAARDIEFAIDSSQRSVSNLFVRATAGVRPFAPTSHHSNGSQSGAAPAPRSSQARSFCFAGAGGRAVARSPSPRLPRARRTMDDSISAELR
jgi:hypothetical protein